MKRKHLVQIMFGETGAAQVSELSQHLHVSHRFVVYSGWDVSAVSCQISRRIIKSAAHALRHHMLVVTCVHV